LTSLFFAFVAAAVLVIKPLNVETYSYEWIPAKASDSGVFPLDRSWPKSLEVSFRFTCESNPNHRVLSLGGFEITCLEEKLNFSSGNLKAVPLVGEENDSFQIVFNAAKSTIEVRNLSLGVSKEILLKYENFPKVTQLSAEKPEVDNVSVLMETRPSSINNDPLRIVIFCCVLFFALLAVLLIRKEQKPIFETRKTFRKFYKQAILVLTGLLASAFSIPMFYDDGWVIQRVKQYLSTGYFGDFYFHSNAWLPQGYIHESVWAVFLNFDATYLEMRLFVVILLFFSWLICLKSIHILRNALSQRAVWISSAIFVSISAVWCMSLRAEAWVSFFLSLQFYFFVKFFTAKNWIDFFLSGFFAALAVSSHQSGMVALVGAISIVVIALKEDAWNKIPSLAISVGSIFAVFLAMFFVGYDFSSLLASVKDFSDSAYENRLNEFNRIAELSGTFISSARKFGWVLILATVVLAISRYNQLDKTSRVFSLVLLCYPLGLILTSSKWGWHVGVLSIPVFLLSLIVLNSFDWPKPQRYNLKIWLPLLTLGVGISIASKGGWGTYDYRQFAWNDYSEFFAGNVSQFYWLVLAAVMFVVGFFIDQARENRFQVFSSVLVIILCIFPSLSSITWIFIDSFAEKTPGTISWTVLRQNLKSAMHLDDNSCGILGSVPAYSVSVSRLQIEVLPVSFPQMESKPATLFGWNNFLSWSTEQSNNQLFQTPYYKLSKTLESDSNFSFWWRTVSEQSENPIYLTIASKLESGQILYDSFTLERSTVGGVWNRFQLSLAPGTESFAIVATGNEDDYLEFTQPVVEKIGNAKTTLSKGTSFIPPSYLPSVPCAKLPSSNDGLFAVPDFIISQNYNLDTRMWIEQYFTPGSSMITQIGQVEKDVPTIWRIKFQLPQNVVKAKA
jgi:hypothetical protein